MSIEAETLECPNEDCYRNEVSATLANFNAIGKSLCPTCKEVLE